MYVERLVIENVRCFESTVLEPRYPGLEDDLDIDFKNVTLLLGDNGSGKSTTLRCLAIGVLSRVLEVSEYQPDSVVRKGSKGKIASVSARVSLGLLDRGPNKTPKGEPLVFTTHITREGDYERLGKQEGPYIPDLFVDLTPTFFLVGYGATRRVQSSGGRGMMESKPRGLRFARVSSLFYDFVALTPLTAWLPHLKRSERRRFAEVKALINKLLPAEIRFTGLQEERNTKSRVSSFSTDLVRDYVFKLERQKLPFRALSDGYRAYIAWVADLVYHLCQCTPRKKRMRDISGLVLVDEIDLHLHPSWQREVMGTISHALPNLQFVCTTHSPIVAGTLKRGQVFVMERQPNGAVKIVQMEERLHGLNADQILTSSYFGLTTTRAPGFVDELHSLRHKAWQGDKKATLEFLEKMSGQPPTARPKKRVTKSRPPSTRRKVVNKGHRGLKK